MLYGPDGKPIRVQGEDELPVITFVITKNLKQFAWFCKKQGVRPEIDNVHHLTNPRQLMGIDPEKYLIEFKHWGDYKDSPVMDEGGEWQYELKRMMAQAGEENPLDYKRTDEVELKHEHDETLDNIDKGGLN